MHERIQVAVSAPRLRAGAELRRIRENQGLSGVAVAGALGWSQSKVSRIETGRFGATVWELAELAEFYGVPEEVRAEILTIAAEDSGLPGAWIVRAGGPGRRRGEVAMIESRTRQIRQYQAAAVPGLLQAPGYTRALTAAGGFGDVDDVVRHRADRQATAFGAGELEYAVLLEEVALLRSSPTVEVLHEQIEHLLRLAQLPGVDIRLLTADSAPSTAPMNSFLIYDFLSAKSPSVVLVETQTADLYLSAKDDVSTYEHTFAGLQAAALSAQATATRFRRLLRGRL